MSTFSLQPQSPEAVARRAFILHAVWHAGLGVNRPKLLRWLAAEGLANDLSAWERDLFAPRQPDKATLSAAAWRSEALFAVLWAQGLSETMGAPDERCTYDELDDMMPDLFTPIEAFLGDSLLRPESELVAETAELAACYRRLSAEGVEDPLSALNLRPVRERLHALNWITGIGGDNWDHIKFEL